MVRPTAPLPAVLVALGAGIVALAGGYWDDAWHTERGRDEFFIAPHVAIYAGVAVAGAALAAWAALAVRAGGLAEVRRHRSLGLAVVAVAVTLISGPVDNAWHVAFGRDAVIWSPPHMLGIAGTLALGAALLSELATAGRTALAYAAGGLVLAAASFATVEYETDVPQFDELWYLPVLGLALSVALVLVRSALGARWSASLSALAFTVFALCVAGFVALVGFAPPPVPLVVLPAIAVDVAARRSWSAPLTAGAFTVVVYAVYVPARNWLGDGVEVGAGDVALGLPLTWAVCVLVFALGRDIRRVSGSGPSLRTALPTALIVAMMLPASAAAHDPGQGEDTGAIDLTVSAVTGDATVRGRLDPRLCADAQPVAVVARRAGRVMKGALEKRGCDIAGRVRLPSRGRWFVYAELRRGGDAIESWLPVEAGSGSDTTSDDGRYAYVVPERSGGAVKWLGGALLYAAMLALLFATLRLVRSSARARPSRAPLR